MDVWNESETNGMASLCESHRKRIKSPMGYFYLSASDFSTNSYHYYCVLFFSFLRYLSIIFVIHTICVALLLYGQLVFAFMHRYELWLRSWRRRATSGNRRNRSSCVTLTANCGFKCRWILDKRFMSVCVVQKYVDDKCLMLFAYLLAMNDNMYIICVEVWVYWRAKIRGSLKQRLIVISWIAYFRDTLRVGREVTMGDIWIIWYQMFLKYSKTSCGS